MRFCSRCKKEKELSEFYPDPRKKLGIEYRCKECAKAKRRKYYYANPEKSRKAYREYETKRRREDPIFDMRKKLRNRLRRALKGRYKTGSAISDLGCSVEQLKQYLENKFREGMSWENYGKGGWEIDHIIPLSRVDLSNREEIKRVCHYSNLQPLWAHENMRKHNKV